MKSITPDQTKNFNGSWKFDDGKNNPIMKAACQGVNISQNENELQYEIISSRNDKEDSISKRYNFGELETVEKVKNQFEDSVTTTSLELQDDGKLLINSVRILDDGESIGKIIYEMTWELMNDGQTLKVSNTANMPEKSEFSEMLVITVYYSKA